MRERRKTFRVEWNSEAKIYDRDGRFARRCIVSNFSNGGAKIIGLDPSAVPEQFILRISPHSRPQRCRVIWHSDSGFGVKFTSVVKDRGALTQMRRGEKRKALQRTHALA